ncbi:MAG TPA: Hsp20/alpha crystallin family protein [Polyangiaceae bacterium]|jgi:HSP20 family protein
MAEARDTNNPQQTTTAQGQARPQEGKESAATLARRSAGEMSQPDWTSSPFSFMRRFMGEMDHLFEDFGFGAPEFSGRPGRALERMRGEWSPQVDVLERDGQLLVHADLPGLRQDDVKVSVDRGILSISGERSHQHQHEKGGVYQCERSYGSFRRTIALPDGIEPESIKASFADGVLEVTMPMPKSAPTGRNIPIGPKTTGVKH